ncbi:conserved hypothetical protein [Corynebacterium striatum]|nr:conserved hypothetical protein [Corynebacterium striatum]
MVVKYSPRHEIIDLRVWNPAMTSWWGLTDFQGFSLEGRADWTVTAGSVTVSADHALAPRLRSARHVPVPISFAMNGVRWDGAVESVETGKKDDGSEYVIARFLSDHKHFGRMLARGPVVSAADDSSETLSDTIGSITKRLVSTGAVRTGLPTYILIDDDGDPVEVEVRTEDYVTDVVADVLAGSNSFVEVRKLLPGQPIPGNGTVEHYAGVMERQWEQYQLDAGYWANAATSPRIKGVTVGSQSPAYPDNSWSGKGMRDKDSMPLSEPMSGVCFHPFETIVNRPLGYYAEVDPANVHVVTRQQIENGPGAAAGRPHYVTHFKAGTLDAVSASHLKQCVEKRFLKRVDGTLYTSVDETLRRFTNTDAYAWKDGISWHLATAEEFEKDNQKYKPRGAKQKQTPGILVWQHAGRDRRGVVFSSAPGGGLKAWSATESAPDGAMLIAGGQMDAQTIAALESGALKPKGTVQSVDESTASAILPASAGLPSAVEQLDIDVQPNATISGTEVSFSKAGGRVDINQAGPFFLREKYMSLSSTGGANPVSEIAREWAKSQGSTTMTFTPGHHQTVVFGDDVTLPDGRVVPGWKPGDRVSFVDGTTRVSEVIMGFSVRAGANEPVTVEPILGREVNGVLSGLRRRIEENEKAAKKAFLAPPRKVPRGAVKAIADESAARVEKSLAQASKDLSDEIAKTVKSADFAEYSAELQAKLWGSQGEFNKITAEFQKKQGIINLQQAEINRQQGVVSSQNQKILEVIQENLRLQSIITSGMPRIVHIDTGKSNLWTSSSGAMSTGDAFGEVVFDKGTLSPRPAATFTAKPGWVGTVLMLAVADNGSSDVTSAAITESNRTHTSVAGGLYTNYKSATVFIFPAAKES